MVDDFDSETTDNFVHVLRSPGVSNNFAMEEAFNNSLFMAVFTFCFAGALSIFVLTLFILLHRLLVSDKYIISKGRITFLIVGYVMCMLICVVAVLLIIVGVSALHEGLNLRRPGDEEVKTVTENCDASMHCILHRVNTHVVKGLKDHTAASLRFMPDLKEQLKNLFQFFDYLQSARIDARAVFAYPKCRNFRSLLKQINEVADATYTPAWRAKLEEIRQMGDEEEYAKQANLKNAHTSFDSLLEYGREMAALTSEIKDRTVKVEEQLDDYLNDFLNGTCQVLSDFKTLKNTANRYIENNEYSLHLGPRMFWITSLIVAILVISITGFTVVILRHCHYASDTNTNKHRVLFAVFDLVVELLGYFTLVITILAFTLAGLLLYAAFSPELLCIGLYGKNATATLNGVHRPPNHNYTSAVSFQEMATKCFAGYSQFNIIFAGHWIYKEDFDQIFYDVNLDPPRETVNELNTTDLSILLARYQQFNSFIKGFFPKKFDKKFFQCTGDEKLDSGNWSQTVPGLLKSTPLVVQLMIDSQRLRIEFYKATQGYNDFTTVKSMARNYLKTQIDDLPSSCAMAIAWKNSGSTWCHIVPYAMQHVFVACFLIGIAALLLQKLCFDTVDFIPFVAPCALEVATQRSETTLVTAEPLRLMPSLTNVGMLSTAKPDKKKGKRNILQPTQEASDDSGEDFVPPQKLERTQEVSEKSFRPVVRRSVYSNSGKMPLLPGNKTPPQKKRKDHSKDSPLRGAGRSPSWIKRKEDLEPLPVEKTVASCEEVDVCMPGDGKKDKKSSDSSIASQPRSVEVLEAGEKDAQQKSYSYQDQKATTPPPTPKKPSKIEIKRSSPMNRGVITI